MRGEQACGERSDAAQARMCRWRDRADAKPNHTRMCATIVTWGPLRLLAKVHRHLQFFESTGKAKILLGDVWAAASSCPFCPFWLSFCVGVLCQPVGSFCETSTIFYSAVMHWSDLFRRKGGPGTARLVSKLPLHSSEARRGARLEAMAFAVDLNF